MRSTAPPQSRQIIPLTGMRAFLIGWIVLYHLKDELTALFPTSAFYPLLDFAGTGFIGVDFFFITSGFIIAYTYASRFKRFNLRTYKRFLWLRLARIYPVHLFTLAIACLLFLAASVAGAGVTNPDYYTTANFVQNIFLVQAWSVPTAFSWNAVSWAVSLEWLAYLSFPLIIALTLRIRSKSAVLTVIVALLWAMTASCLLLEAGQSTPYGAGSYGLFRMAGEFMAGCLMYNLYINNWGAKWHWGWISDITWFSVIVGSVYLLGTSGSGMGNTLATQAAAQGAVQAVAQGDASALTAVATMAGQLNVLWVTPLCALAVYALVWERGFVASLFSIRPMVYVGHISYALYLTHFLCLIVLRRVVPLEKFGGSQVLQFGAFLGYLIVMLCAAALTYRLIEEPARLWMKRVAMSRDDIRKAAIAKPSQSRVTALSASVSTKQNATEAITASSLSHRRQRK